MQLNSHQFEEVYKKLGIDLDTLGCIMLDLEPIEMPKIMYDGFTAFPKEGLYYSKNEKRFWIDGWVVDKVAHITLLYGLLENGHILEKEVEKVLANWNLDEVEIEKIDYFNSNYPDENYYCIVAHIKMTPELLEGHQRLEFLPHINTFTGYKPHMTICYIDKGQGEKYRDDLIDEFNKLWAGKKLKIKGVNLGDKQPNQ